MFHMPIDTITLLNIVLIMTITAFSIQLYMFMKMMKISRSLSRLFAEFKALLQRETISPVIDFAAKDLYEYNTCKYCRHRMSFIQIADEKTIDNFYYKCKIHKKDISLEHTCRQFERDLTYK